jgi:hypothetical protein
VQKSLLDALKTAKLIVDDRKELVTCETPTFPREHKDDGFWTTITLIDEPGPPPNKKAPSKPRSRRKKKEDA